MKKPKHDFKVSDLTDEIVYTAIVKTNELYVEESEDEIPKLNATVYANKIIKHSLNKKYITLLPEIQVSGIRYRIKKEDFGNWVMHGEYNVFISVSESWAYVALRYQLLDRKNYFAIKTEEIKEEIKLINIELDKMQYLK